MAKKSIGYVELEWRCPICGARNPGSARVCTGCGAPQPDHVEFETPASQELVADDEDLAQARAAPDVHCPYCEARNPATATVCKQCGGDLTGAAKRDTGKVLGAHAKASAPPQICPACGGENDASARTCATCGSPLEGPAPVVKARPRTPVAETSTSGGSLGKILIAIAVVAVLGILTFVVLGMRTKESVARVSGAEWTRTIEIEGLVPIEYSAWRDSVPQGAQIVSCAQERRRTVTDPEPGAVEVCGTPYTVDTGTGFGEVVQDCEYEVYDDMCEYTVLEWREVDRLVASGTDMRPVWPVLELSTDQRAGEESAVYRCRFTVDDDQYVYVASSEEEYRLCELGSTWELEVNTFGSVVSARPR